MATYVVLGNFTDQGIRNVKDSPERLAAFKAAAEKLGVSIRHAWYTVGAHDMTVVVEGPDEAIIAGLLKLGSLGNVRTTSMRAWSADEMKAIVGRIG
ncbi:MAG TPA: GYD domain-containing protein [Casimicrobiaceae bacterium]|nr:GYD domain-containing protein [Casimicrobiaceae bacterium]